MLDNAHANDKGKTMKSRETKSPVEVVVYESAIESRDHLHRVLKEACGFPPYYGCNLGALNDVLGERSTPLSIILVLSRLHDDPQDYWFRFAMVCMRQAFENENVSFRIEHDRTQL